MRTKATPKSCSCRMCRRGKGTRGQKELMKLEHRGWRHAMKVALAKGQEVEIAQHGAYTD